MKPHKDYPPITQTWEKLIFVRKQILGVEKCPQIHIVPNYIKEPEIAIFSIISNINELIVDNDADLWVKTSGKLLFIQ